MKKIFLILVFGLFMIGFSSAALTEDIKGYYKLDNNNFSDSTPNGNDLSNSGTANASGIIIDGREYSGADSMDATGFSDSTNDYTFQFWLKPDTVTGNQIIFDDDGGDAGDRIILYTTFGDGKIGVFVDGGLNTFNTVANTGAWNHVVYVFNSSDSKIYLYLNGTKQGTEVAYTSESIGNAITLGAAEQAKNNNYDGIMDEVSIWNRSLNSTEITTLYNSGAGLSYPFGEVGDITVTLTLPTNGSIIEVTDINFTTSISSDITNLTNATYFIWYANGTLFNQTVVTLPNAPTANQTLEINDFIFSGYKWNVYACVITGECSFAAQNSTFIVSPFSVDATTFNESVYETSLQTFIINISAISTVSSVTGLFWYNGTSYDALISNPSNGIYSATSTLDIPLQNSVGNKSFKWQFDFTLTGFPDTQQNTSAYSHEVNRTYIRLCNGTYSSNIINFTTRNSENPFPKLNATFKSAWEWYLGSGDVIRNMSYEDVNENRSDFDFCGLDDDIDYIFNVDIENDATDFAKNFYYFTDAPQTSGTPANTDLYLLNDTLATPTTLLVRDRYQRVLENVLVYVQLYDVGTDSFYTVTMGKTNQNGEDIVYINWFDSLYKFILVENGTTVLTTDAYKVGETPQIFQIEEDIVYDLDKFDDFEYLLRFSNVTNNFVLTYVKPNGLVESGCLRVLLRESSSDTEICEVCSTSASATLYCDISSAGNGTFIATFYATGSLSVIDWITEEVGIGISETIYLLLDKDDSAFYSILTSVIVLGVFLINPVFGVIAIIGGLLLASVLGFAIISYLTFLFITCVGGIIIWILRR